MPAMLVPSPNRPGRTRQAAPSSPHARALLDSAAEDVVESRFLRGQARRAKVATAIENLHREELHIDASGAWPLAESAARPR